MKKIIYSGYLKIFAVILFVASIVLGALIVTGGIVAYHNEDEQVYSLENDFSESWQIDSLLHEPERTVYDAYRDPEQPYDFLGNPIYETNSAVIAHNLTQRFNDLYYTEEVNYFVQWNDLVFTNCGATTPEELMQGECFSYVRRDSQGNIERSSSDINRMYLMENLEAYDSTSTIIISCSLTEDTVKAYKALWEKQESMVIDTFIWTLVCVGVALLALIYLICVCGKNKDGQYKNMWLDNIWLELHLAVLGGCGIGAAVVCALLLDEYLAGYFPIRMVYPVVGAAAALGSLGVITALLSIIRNIKTGRLLENSIVFRIFRWTLRLFIRIVKWIWRKTKTFWRVVFRTLSRKTGIIIGLMMLVYTVAIGFCGLLLSQFPVFLFITLIFLAIAMFFIGVRAGDLDEIKKGVNEVRCGNVAYKIAEPKCEDMKALAENINDIAKGLDESVSAKVKAERLKTELITNVSHDLKTPITSIISYTELLSKIEDLPEEARDYVSVIAKKSDRLKRLTQDLFDISKVQSGNENVVLEKLDVALLIQQALGEQDNEIQSSGLTFCVEAPNQLYIAADGRKMSRVVSNLLGNILKYTLKNTRVFITATEKDGFAVMEFKNISAYPLNFKADEITQRFVRGDESRTMEGNGLGLAIAKSYTELCGGGFEIVTDGDLFKAILKFRKYG